MLTLEQGYRVSTDGLTIECNSRGLPSTTTLWSEDGRLLTSADVYTPETRVLRHYQSTQYSNSLTLDLLKDVVGIISCDVYGDWVTADKRNSGRQSKSHCHCRGGCTLKSVKYVMLLAMSVSARQGGGGLGSPPGSRW
jgi:hypothetical protein